ncbi:MAG: GTPase Era [Deltaproteobacteria bacterium]|nr:MAG: GTPase Era [Deltaproteobacteria bacterium]
MSEGYQSGFVSIVGRPNVGKSTLLNTILGEKISIISPKPQTTRNRITGIKHLPNAQIVFLDTPGIHEATTRLNRYMVETALMTLKEVDLLLFMTESTLRPEDTLILETLGKIDRPRFGLINKIDRVAPQDLLPTIDHLGKTELFEEIVPISALTGDGVGIVLDLLLERLPEGPPYFPEDMVTDLPERFLAAEIVREKVFLLTGEEIPYATAVEIDTFEEKAERIVIEATIHVEKPSQKKIVIGKGGGKIKEIGTQARLDLEALLGTKVFLRLWVRVQKNWTRNARTLRDFGYR